MTQNSPKQDSQSLDEKNRHILIAIASKANADHPDEWFEPGRKDLMESLSLSESSLKRRTNELVEMGFLVKRPKSSMVKLTGEAIETAFPSHVKIRQNTVEEPESLNVTLDNGTLVPEMSATEDIKKEKLKTTNLSLPKSLHRKVKIYAMDNDLTIVQAITKLLKRALELV
jgi:DNA-binding transcriptional MocR family regulator